MGYLDLRGLFDDIEQSTKRSLSYKGLIPSSEFNSDFYQQFLSVATATELEQDIISKETIEKIARINTYGKA
jgi:hypothetical protein